MTNIDRKFFIKTLRNIADRLEENGEFNLEGIGIEVDREEVFDKYFFGKPIKENKPTGLFSIEFSLFDGSLTNENISYITNELHNHIDVELDYSDERGV